MALISFLPSSPNTSHSHKRNKNNPQNHNKKNKKMPPPPPSPPPPPPPPDTKSSSSSWEQFKNLLSCKNTTSATPSIKRTKKYSKLSSTCSSSICAIRDVVHGNTRVTDHGSSSDSGSHNESTPLSAHSSRRSMRAPLPTSRGGMQLMKLSGCYECHAVDVHSVSRRRYPRPRTLCPCTECGEVFSKSESLEQHQAIRHAVSELSPDDSSRNIVEIIFKSSWQGRNNPPIPICSIERILKVRNTPRTISLFEDHRTAIISRCAAAGNMRRCAADGNELLRFLSAPVSCPLGVDGSTSLCLPNYDPATAATDPPCSVCTIIRHGFSKVVGPRGRIRTTASSGGAHEGSGRRAMLVCRVIAGRVRRKGEEEEDGDDEVEGSKLCYDSMAGYGGDLEEVFVDNPRAILPCFVVIYKAS